MSNLLEFSAADHTYRLDALEIPGVTTVLKSAGLVDTSFFTDESAWKGTAVHLCCAYDDEGTLDESTVDESVKGYLEGWRKFKREMAFMPLDIERMVHGKIGGMEFAGTPDRVGMLGLLRMVVDLKSGAISRATALQTAAYAELTNCQHRVAVRLTPGAKYSVKVFPASELRRDLAQFRAALSNWWWARRKA